MPTGNPPRVTTGLSYYTVRALTFTDGIEIARSYHRTVYCPGDDISEAPQEVKDVAGVLWTTAVIEAYKASLVDPVLETTSALPATEKKTD